MSSPYASYPVSERQIDTALEHCRLGKEHAWVQRLIPPYDHLIQVTVRGRHEMEAFMLVLATIVAGDALVGEVSKLPTVVDVEDLLSIMEIFRMRMDEEQQADVFSLVLEYAA
jgi:hypothetical protein